MTQQLQNKTVFLTGAARGIGACCAEVFVQMGARVYLVDRDEAALFALADRLNQNGQVTIPKVLDITNKSDVEAAAKEMVDHWGQIDILVNALIPTLMALALLLFIWGVIQYFILGADDEGKRETGRAYMLYAIIGLVAIVAVWGIVNLVVQILGTGYGTAPAKPGVPK